MGQPNANAGGTTQVLISSHQHDAPSNRGYEIALVRVAGQTHQQVKAQVFAKAGATAVTVQPSTGNPDDWRHIVLTYQPPTRRSGWHPPALRKRCRIGEREPISAHDGQPGRHQCAIVQRDIQVWRRPPSASAAAPENFYTGLVDNVAFYNRVLPLNDVQDHFKKF